MSLAMLFRTSCTACGSKLLKWFPEGRHLIAQLPPTQREEAQQMIDWWGPDARLEAWICGKCAHFGIIESGGMEGATLI